ncbi:MAG: hypothetical protein B6D36_06480 [Planctomycetes bacterium UTPLA1]|jgi:tetratricopeptide (TPR) repeat protein|nr:MAG: hypothetical protein B6D36_06480 [Planctomycetes bacterium UTPLA1]
MIDKEPNMSQNRFAVCLGLVLGILTVWIPTPAVAQQADAGPSIKSPEDMLEEAILKIDAGEYQEAATLYDRAKRSKPNMPRLALALGLLRIQQSRAAEAINILEEFNKDAGNEFRGYYAIGRVYNESRMYLQAVRPLERAKDFAPVELNGKNVKAEIAIELAIAYNGRALSKEALRYADEAAALAPNDPGVQLKLGQMNLNTQDYASALRAAEKSISLLNGQLRADPFKPDNNLELKEANTLRVSILEAQRAADPDDANTYFTLGAAMRDQANSERRIALLRAREYALEGVNKDPKLHECSVFLARLEWELGGAQDALDRLKGVLADDANNADAARLRDEILASLRQQAAP